MALTAPNSTPNRWDGARVAGASELDALVYRSNLLASDRSVVNFGGGNTSVKVRQRDHAGREVTVLWVKGSGSDLATIDAAGFAGLRLDEILPLRERGEMSDEQMVAYLARCQLDPAMPRPSIETLLHAFTPAAHVDTPIPMRSARSSAPSTASASPRSALAPTRSGSPTSAPASRFPSLSPTPSPSTRRPSSCCWQSTAW